MTDRALTPPEYARRLGIKVDRVLAFIKAGELAAVDLRSPGASRPRWRIKPEAIEAFEQRRANGDTTKQTTTNRKPRRSRSGVTQFF